MTTPNQEFIIVSLRNQPTELHLSDGTVAFIEPRGTLALSASVRSSPQLVALERERALRVLPASAARPPEGHAHAEAKDEPDDDAQEEGGEDEADEGSTRTRSKSKRTRSK